MERNLEMKSAKELLGNLKVVKISGMVSEILEGRDADSNVFVLELDEPFKRVTSSLEYETEPGVREKLVLEDVSVVKIHQSNLPDDFKMDESLEFFSYEGDALKKDVSGTGDVWLVQKYFSEKIREDNRARSEQKRMKRSSLRIGAKVD